MTGTDLLQSPLPFAALAALVAFAIALATLGVLRRQPSELRAALAAMCAMKWRELSHHVIAMLSHRGLRHDDLNRRPGEDGFDISMTRGAARYLVQCKQGGSFHVTPATVREFAALVRLQGAEGGILVTTGDVEAPARRLASNSGVELVAGEDLWRQIEPLLPLDVLHEIRADAAAQRRRRAGTAALLALGAGLAGFLAAAALGPRPPIVAAPLQPEPAPARVEASGSAPATPVERPVEAAVANLPPMPDPTLADEEIAARRAEVERTVRELPRVANASWSTRSTMLLALRTDEEGGIPEAVVDAVCRELVRFEELRYTRLQVQVVAPRTEEDARVRWRQCR